MSRARNPFRPGVVLGVLAIGALAFLLMLYAIGQGWTGGGDRNGGEHAASNGLTGFAGLASLAENTGYQVEISRSRAAFDDYGLLVLTPPLFTDPDALADLIAERRDSDLGPTLLILPKWFALPVPDDRQIDSEPGWVTLGGANSPGWFGALEWAEGGELAIGETRGWSGLSASGSLPDEEAVQALVDQPDSPIEPLVVDSEGDILAGVLPSDSADYAPYQVVVVFEPDLMNNFGMADRSRAQLALAIIDVASEGEDMPILFDVTLAGLGASENLLTLAFAPPFLAATLCLLLAALVVAWRGFRRFGPPVAEAASSAHGKRQLAMNGAALVARVKRFHLLKAPYEALVGRRIAERLGLRVADIDERETAIDRVLAGRGHSGPGFARLAADLRAAERPGEIIRAASALRTFERNLLP